MTVNGETHGPPHTAFNEEIWRWTLTIPIDKWYPVASVKKMPQEDFIECIKYLICCGEPLLFNDDFSAFKKFDIHEYDYVDWTKHPDVKK